MHLACVPSLNQWLVPKLEQRGLRGTKETCREPDSTGAAITAKDIKTELKRAS